MGRYLTLRLLQAMIVLAVMSGLVFVLIGAMPGDPVDLMISASPELSSADAARLRALHGLDQPMWARYWNWLGAVVSGEFGQSRLYHLPATEILGSRLANSLLLMVPALVLSLALALPLGVTAAERPGSWLDGAVNLGCFACLSIPPFWFALLLIMLFSVTLGWLPAGGIAPPAGGGIADTLVRMVMPVTTLVVASVGSHTRYVRAAVREVLSADFIRTARAKGASETRVVWRHALRNALVPVVTILALDLGMLVSGALVTETMFAWPGVGMLITQAVLGNDFNIALLALLVVTAMTLAGSLAADLAYAALDPRIALGARSS